jgi:hypothetical protein
VIGAEHEAQAHWTASFLMPAYFEDEPIKVEPVDAVSSQHSNAITPEAPSPTRQPAMISAGEPMPDIRRSFGVSSVALFWWLTCILTLVGVPLTMGLSGFGYFWGIAIIILLCFPGIQLVSALLTAIIYGIWERPDQDYQLRQVGKIALGVLAGCGLGMGAMIGIGLLLSLR